MRPPASLIALYHAIGTVKATGYRDALSRDDLVRQLDWLERHYAIRPLADLLRLRRAGQPLDGLAAITFDDNHPSVLEVALPLLAARGLPATWSLIGEVLAGRPYWRRLVHRLGEEERIEAFLAFARRASPATVSGLTADRFYKDSKNPQRCCVTELRALLERFFSGEAEDDLIRLDDLAGRMPAKGVILANHSASHPVFAGLSQAEQEAEILGGAAALARTGWPTLPVLTLPFGGAEAYDAATMSALQATGCEAILLTAEEGTAADDLAGHPRLASGILALTRVMLGKEALD